MNKVHVRYFRIQYEAPCTHSIIVQIIPHLSFFSLSLIPSSQDTILTLRHEKYVVLG